LQARSARPTLHHDWQKYGLWMTSHSILI